MSIQYKVTIGIPVYRAVEYINYTILSALNQTFQSIEFLIVDDCGKDGSMDILLKYQKTHNRGRDIRILVNEVNQGVSYCRNRIIDEAKGRFVFFLDADDLIESNTIQLLYDEIVCHNAQIAYGSYDIIDRINNTPVQVFQKEYKVLFGEDVLAMYAFSNNKVFHISVCNNLIDIFYLRQLGLKFIDVSFWEDMAFTMELVIRVTKAVLLPNITYHYIRHEGSLSRYQKRQYIMKDEIKNNLLVLNHLKVKFAILKEKSYAPYLYYNLEMNCFYVFCYILKNYHKIDPRFTFIEMKNILKHPVTFNAIVKFSSKRMANLTFSLLGTLPVFFLIPIIWMIGKFKKVT